MGLHSADLAVDLRCDRAATGGESYADGIAGDSQVRVDAVLAHGSRILEALIGVFYGTGLCAQGLYSHTLLDTSLISRPHADHPAGFTGLQGMPERDIRPIHRRPQARPFCLHLHHIALFIEGEDLEDAHLGPHHDAALLDAVEERRSTIDAKDPVVGL